MKAIIKKFFLHGVGNRFFKSAKSRFKIQGKQRKQPNSKLTLLKTRKNRFLKYRKWFFFPQMLIVLRLARQRHILFLQPSSQHDVLCQNQHIKRLIHKGYKVRRI